MKIIRYMQLLRQQIMGLSSSINHLLSFNMKQIKTLMRLKITFKSPL